MYVGATTEIYSISSFVLWCIGLTTGVIKNEQDNHDKDIEARPNGELRVNSTEDMIKYLKIKGRVELCNHNRANEITTTTTTLAPGYDK